ncbi:MAG: glycosyltransferase [Candidatus Hodarchaeales archaeon]
MPQLLEQANIVVVPSVCEEVLSHFVLEGMAVGKPIIVSDIGAYLTSSTVNHQRDYSLTRSQRSKRS